MKINPQAKIEDEIHFFILKDKKIRYLCNQACSVTKGKYTNDFFDITCSKCKSMMVKDSLKHERLLGITEGKKLAVDEVLKMVDTDFQCEYNTSGRCKNEDCVCKFVKILKEKLNQLKEQKW